MRLALALLLGGALAALAGARLWPAIAPVDRGGLPTCPASARDDLLLPEALECWFEDRDLGPWRLTSAVYAHDMIVVRVEAATREVAGAVAQHLVGQYGEVATELLVYASDAKPARGARPVRRVRWTPAGGTETAEFIAP